MKIFTKRRKDGKSAKQTTITHKNFLKFRLLYIKLLPLHKTKKIRK